MGESKYPRIWDRNREREIIGETKLLDAVREMATACRLQNSEQITETRGAIGAVRMIQREYLDLHKQYVAAIMAAEGKA